jgi:hypothetical protein
MNKTASFVLFFAICLSLIGTGFGEIFVGNAEFEDVPLTPGSWTYSIYPWACDNISGGYDAWVSNGYYSGEPEPLTPALYAEGNIVYQEVSAIYQEGGIYTFSIDVAIQKEDVWEIFFYDATAGDHLTHLSSVSGPEPDPVYGQWVRKSVMFEATALEANHRIGIGLSGGPWTMFDNAAVETTAGDTDSHSSRSATLTIRKMLGYWKLDETEGSVAADSSIYGRDGTLINMDESDWVAGLIDNCLEFDGVDDYVAIQDLYYNDKYREVTVSTWILTSESGDQIIASYDRNEYWRLEINGEGAGAGRVGWDMMTDAGQVDFGSSRRVDDGQWHLVAGVFDNGTLTIYIDGTQDASTSRGGTFGSGTVRYGFFGVGSEATEFNDSIGPQRYFNGRLDDFRIYNYALEPLEVANLYLEVKPDETICLSHPTLDLSGPNGEPDCVVSLFDFALIASQWMQCGIVPDCI